MKLVDDTRPTRMYVTPKTFLVLFSRNRRNVECKINPTPLRYFLFTYYIAHIRTYVFRLILSIFSIRINYIHQFLLKTLFH